MFTRRNFLTTAGLLTGAGLFGGAALTGRPTRAADGDPRRIVIFLEGNGIRPECVRDPLTLETLEGYAGKPIESNRDYGHDDPVLVSAAPLAEARSLAALAAKDDDISLVERACLVLGLSGTYLGGGHSTDFGALSASQAAGGPAGPTIETVLSAIPEVRGNTPFDAIRIGVGAATTPLNYSSCAFDAGKPAPLLLSPAASFASLFGSVASGEAGEEFESRKQLLEFALEDVMRELKGFGGSKRGRDKLETYEASLLTMLARNDQILGMKGALQANKPLGPGESDPDPYASGDPLEQLRLQADIATASLLSGLTNVAVVSFGAGSYYWSLEYPSLSDFYPSKQVIGGHDLRHGESPAFYETLHEVTSRGIGEMARMARALAARPEQGGTMLDNTLLLYMSDNGEKHHSNAEEWAMLMLGGNNMGFKTDGRSVTYPKSGHENNRQTSNLFNSLLHGAGLPTDDFGHSNPVTRIAEGPLAEVWS
ncbi:DUF1552 domain-containing protein [Nannocystis bainbridge]|uniref:DUF1552 domain-containing protein n=1 Tax=Nannocystis bainbridge TaxID=2995303 RepID=A0ABT5E5U5_9BACT|nr:DUF1552 domain-containing protein [Nannocystis bainbridge]MDC0721225.1 DUF1552 domain-containing protein [Nannocystis bainbridge]